MQKAKIRIVSVWDGDTEPAHEVGDVAEVVITAEGDYRSEPFAFPDSCAPGHHFVWNGYTGTIARIEVLAPVPLFMSTDSAERKLCPVAEGFLGYFPDAALCVAFVSYNGNQKHNPGEPLHWAKEKSADEKDAEVRHMLDALRGLPPDPGLERLGKLGHLASKAWRALADLQRACDAERAEFEALSPALARAGYAAPPSDIELECSECGCVDCPAVESEDPDDCMGERWA